MLHRVQKYIEERYTKTVLDGPLKDSDFVALRALGKLLSEEGVLIKPDELKRFVLGFGFQLKDVNQNVVLSEFLPAIQTSKMHVPNAIMMTLRTPRAEPAEPCPAVTQAE